MASPSRKGIMMTDIDWAALDPLQIAALNTREALERFWALDYIETYFGPPDDQNLTLYDTVAGIAKSLYPAPSRLSIADVGCGPGQGLAALERAFPAHTLDMLGIDWAESALTHARPLVPEARFICRDILTETWLDDKQMDLVICLEMLEHQYEVKKTLSELLRVTLPGGHVLITVPNGEIDEFIGHRHFWSLEDFRELLAPFSVFEVYYIRNGTNLLAHLVRGT